MIEYITEQPNNGDRIPARSDPSWVYNRRDPFETMTRIVTEEIFEILVWTGLYDPQGNKIMRHEFNPKYPLGFLHFPDKEEYYEGW